MVSAREVAAGVQDPELSMLTIADLGVLRDVREEAGHVTVEITPTYSGCPAMGAIRTDIVRRLNEAGYLDVEVRTALHPAWTTDWITPDGKRKLAEHGIAPPGSAPRHRVTLMLGRREPATCPRCGSSATVEVSRFGATACKALHRCTACDEPFESVKAI